MRWTWLTGEGAWSWAEANQVGRVITPLSRAVMSVHAGTLTLSRTLFRSTAASQAQNGSTADTGFIGPQGFLFSQNNQISSLPNFTVIFESLILSPFCPLDLLRST